MIQGDMAWYIKSVMLKELDTHHFQSTQNCTVQSPRVESQNTVTNHLIASILGQINASMIYLLSKYDQGTCPFSSAKLEVGGNSNMCIGCWSLFNRWSQFFIEFLLCWLFNKDVNEIHIETKNNTSLTADWHKMLSVCLHVVISVAVFDSAAFYSRLLLLYYPLTISHYSILF